MSAKELLRVAEQVMQLDRVSFSYGTALVLEDVSCEISQQDFACIIGPNGGGKTTLLRVMLGILVPQQGTVSVFGRPPNEVCPRIGYMPQHARLDLQFPVSVLDVVLMGRLGHAGAVGPYGTANREHAMQALARVGLGDAAPKRFGTLSGGQRQRVLIARALACDPDLLLLDEPTAGLDLNSQNELYELLHTLNERVTIIMVSHDVAFVSKFVKTVLCVNRTIDMHAAGEIAGTYVSSMYGPDMRMIMHDHDH